jgi:DNA-binding transcriptional MerR regulator
MTPHPCMTQASADPHNWPMPKRYTLTTPQLLAAVEELEGERLDDSTIGRWAAQGVVEPSAGWDRQTGRHHARRYTTQDLAVVRLVVRLRQAGVSMQRVAAILHNLKRRTLARGFKSADAALLVEGWRAWIDESGREKPAPGGARVKLGELAKRNDEVAAALTGT